MKVRVEAPLWGNVGKDQDIVVSKWIGMEGSVRIVQEMKEQLNTRFPKAMLATLQALELSTEKEAALAEKSGASAIQRPSWGGIYGALYELARLSGVGLEIDLRAIPIRQETVEICEYLGLNPYYLHSGGCTVLTCDRGERLVRTLREEGIPAALIGRTTAGRAKAVLNEGHIGYLERPKLDELKRLSGEIKGEW